MQCKKIIHLVGQTDPKKIQESVKGALQMCAQNNLTSISFPALGTGELQNRTGMNTQVQGLDSWHYQISKLHLA
jgi:O-acetyl-ADP-ribose deacetylase (regulator of RNase III)